MKTGTNIIDPKRIVPARGYFLFLTEERRAEKNGIKIAYLDEQTNDWGKCVKMGEIDSRSDFSLAETIRQVEEKIERAGFGSFAQRMAVFIATFLFFFKRNVGSYGYDPGFRQGDRVMVAKLSGRKQFDKKGREYLVLPFSEVSAYYAKAGNEPLSGQAG